MKACRHTALLLLVFTTEFCTLLSQDLPTGEDSPFHFSIRPEELFYDTKALPNGAEVVSYLYHNEIRRFYFVVDQPHTPVSITVTPCGSWLDWNISMVHLAEDGGRQDYKDEDPLLQQQNLARKDEQTFKLLESFTGDGAMTYHSPDVSAGTIKLEMRATQTDASVRMYATTTPHSDHAYPDLPADPTVKVTQVGKRSAAIQWEPSPTETTHSKAVEYCVSVNEVVNFNTYCTMTSHLHGDEPPTIPPNAGFGFEWQRDKKDKRVSVFKKKNRIKNIQFECVGTKRSFSFTRLRPEQQYYIDVYVKNKITGRWSTYSGTSTTTLPRKKKYLSLKDGKMLMGFVKRSRGAKYYEYKVTRSLRRIFLAVKPCSGQLQVDVLKDDKVLKSYRVSNLRKIKVRNITPGVYVIKVSIVDGRSAGFQIFASRKKKKVPTATLR